MHPKLQQGLVPVGELTGSLLFMLPDSDNPWCVLVPPVPDATELHHLKDEQQLRLLADINNLSGFMEKEFHPDKLNIGALGNMVPQLHIHIICRYKSDKAWPNPLWGAPFGTNKEQIEKNLRTLKKILIKS